MQHRFSSQFARIDQVELSLCRCLNRPSGLGLVRSVFRAVSWLGDGWLWYALIAALPCIYGGLGWLVSVHMAAVGAVNLLLYKLVKQRAVRERPYITYPIIRCASAPLDRYSFPSGHTLHAVAFTLLLSHYFPEWAPVLGTFTVLVALSRVILGLHYPSDVAVGAVLGGSLALAALWLSQLLVA